MKKVRISRRGPRFFRLRTRLLTAFLLLSIIPLLLTTTLYQYFSFRSYRSMALAHAQDSVTIVGQRVEESLGLYANSAASLITNIEIVRLIREYDQATLPRKYQITGEMLLVLRTIQSSLTGLLSLEVFTTQQLVAFTVNRTTAPDPTTSQVIRSSLESPARLTWFSTQTFEQPNTISAGIILAGKILDFNTKTVLGHVIMTIDPDVFGRVLESSSLAEKGGLYLTDRDGLILAHPDRAQVMRVQDMAITRLMDGATGTGAYANVSLDTGDHIACVSRINNGQWGVVSLVDLEELMSGLNGLTRLTLLLITLLIVLVVLVALRLAGSISRPIRSMTASMDRINDLDLIYSAGPIDDYEISRLSSAFDQMILRIQRLIDENYRSRLQRAEAEFAALQSQIKPHFLYNTLDSIYWMSYKAGQKSICSLVKSLSDFFKLNLNSGREFCTVANELLMVKSYVEIQTIRYNNRISVTYEMDENLNSLYCLKFILQPLVENAMVHGFLRSDIQGSIMVVVYLKNDRLHLEVTDDGEGFARFPDLCSRESSGSYGLYNVDRRIKLYFGGDYGVYFYNRETGGAVCGVSIPILKSEEEIPFYEDTSAAGGG